MDPSSLLGMGLKNYKTVVANDFLLEVSCVWALLTVMCVTFALIGYGIGRRVGRKEFTPGLLYGRDPIYCVGQRVKTTMGPRQFWVRDLRKNWHWEYHLVTDLYDSGGWTAQWNIEELD